MIKEGTLGQITKLYEHKKKALLGRKISNRKKATRFARYMEFQRIIEKMGREIRLARSFGLEIPKELYIYNKQKNKQYGLLLKKERESKKDLDQFVLEKGKIPKKVKTRWEIRQKRDEKRAKLQYPSWIKNEKRKIISGLKREINAAWDEMSKRRKQNRDEKTWKKEELAKKTKGLGKNLPSQWEQMQIKRLQSAQRKEAKKSLEDYLYYEKIKSVKDIQSSKEVRDIEGKKKDILTRAESIVEVGAQKDRLSAVLTYIRKHTGMNYSKVKYNEAKQEIWIPYHGTLRKLKLPKNVSAKEVVKKMEK